jgi:hypothetical protein
MKIINMNNKFNSKTKITSTIKPKDEHSTNEMQTREITWPRKMNKNSSRTIKR